MKTPGNGGCGAAPGKAPGALYSMFIHEMICPLSCSRNVNLPRNLLCRHKDILATGAIVVDPPSFARVMG